MVASCLGRACLCSRFPDVRFSAKRKCSPNAIRNSALTAPRECKFLPRQSGKPQETMQVDGGITGPHIPPHNGPAAVSARSRASAISGKSRSETVLFATKKQRRRLAFGDDPDYIHRRSDARHVSGGWRMRYLSRCHPEEGVLDVEDTGAGHIRRVGRKSGFSVETD